MFGAKLPYPQKPLFSAPYRPIIRLVAGFARLTRPPGDVLKRLFEGVSTMARKRLTNKEVREMPLAKAGQIVIRDTAVRGLVLVVGTGSKAWRIRYDGKGHKVNEKLGDATIMDLDEARARAMVVLGGLRSGEAPKAYEAPRAPVTVLGAWHSYEADLARKVAAGTRSARTLDTYRSVIRHHFGDWADTPLRDLSRRAGEVAKWHQNISDGRCTTKGGKVVANSCMRLLRAIYQHADDFDLDVEDLPGKIPTRQVQYNPERRRKNALGHREMAAWNLQRLALPSPIKVQFHLLMLLTGSRPDALKKSRWADVDVKARKLHFPSPKGGEGRAFTIPLSRPMMLCLWRARQAGRMLHFAQSREFVFPSGGKSGHLSDTQDRGKLSHFGGSLRQGYISAAVAAGIAEGDVKRLANHSTKGDVTAGYVDDDAIFQHLLTCQNRISSYIVDGLDEKTM